MIYELNEGFSELQPVPFATFAQVARTEKHLEDLLADHLFDVLFQSTPLLPFHQERKREAAADIYALNRAGDIVIFELKREQAESGALDQLLRYAGEAGLWTYRDIERRYLRYKRPDQAGSLREEHARAFVLDAELRDDQFNRQQHLWVVGSAAADHLVRSVDYWRSKGLSIDFFPYRVYRLGGKAYFEFFAKPYDSHVNPAHRKGMILDTNRTWDYLDKNVGYGCLRDMLTKKRVAAYGERKEAVQGLQKDDFVFLYHVWRGVVAAGKVKGTIQKVPHPHYGEEWFWDVDWLTPLPQDFGNIPALGKGAVESLLGKGFYWARTDKRPYLSPDESKHLLEELRRVLTPIDERGVGSAMPEGTHDEA